MRARKTVFCFEKKKKEKIVICMWGLLAALIVFAPAWGELYSPIYPLIVVEAYPHDPTAFTQGLCFYRGRLYESTGLNGASTIREVMLRTGEIKHKWSWDRKYFGEGITVLRDQIYRCENFRYDDD